MKRLHSLWLAIALGAALVLSAGVKPGYAAPAAEAESYTFAFQDADIATVADEVLGRALHLTYVVDPAVAGIKMSFRIDRRLSRPQLLEAFEAALSANGVAMVRQGDSITLAPRAKASSYAPMRKEGGGRGGSGYDVVAVPLSFGVPTEVSKTLAAVTNEHVVLYANDKLGLIVLGGSRAELDAAMETVRVLDRDVFNGAYIRLFDLSQASASAVAGELNAVLTANGVTGLTVIPLKRLNALLVLGRTTQAIDQVGQWILRLDTPSRDLSTQLWVYRPKSVSATSLAAMLSAVLSPSKAEGPAARAEAPAAGGQGGAAPAAAPEAGYASGGQLDDGIRISVDKDSNTLLILAPTARWVALQRTLAEIDRSPRQVLIDVSILEVTLSKDFQFGVDWSVMSSNGDIKVSSVNNENGAIGAAYPGFSVTFLDGNVSAAVTALGSRTDVRVVSAPKVITLDNHTARLQVGQQVPVVTQTTSNTTTNSPTLVSTVDYRDTGIILKVTPRISGDDAVVLEVSQEVSSVAKTITSGIDSPTIQQRHLESTLVIRDGSVVALGGLISANQSRGDSGVPGLKDLPGIGALFKADSRSSSRTELIILITAKILPDQGSSDRATGDLLADMREVQSRGLLPRR